MHVASYDFKKDFTENDVNMLKEWGEGIKQQYRKKRYLPHVVLSSNDEVYVGSSRSGQYYRYNEVKKYLGTTVVSLLKRNIFSLYVNKYCQENVYKPKYPIYQHHQFIRLAFKSLLPIRLKQAIPMFYEFRSWDLYKYEGGIGFAVYFEPEPRTRSRKGIYAYEYVIRYPNMYSDIGLTGSGKKYEKAHWDAFVVIHTLLTDILKYLDSEYEKVNGKADEVPAENLENWIKSQVPAEDVENVAKEISNPFSADPWRQLYEDLQSMTY